ncbi:MAG: Gfo/Idh/MocA family oxidoreductase, partial [Planctomycetota bacterium]
VTAVCDQNYESLLRIRERYPQVFPFESCDSMLERDIVDAVVIATPTATHFQIASQALRKGIHVFVEKPLAKTSEECRKLIELAKEVDRTLFVGHVFLHSAPVLKLREIIRSNELGRISYISSRRLNLGPIRHDVSALYDLAPHDISMISFLLDEQPEKVSCSGLAHVKEGIHDVCNLTMKFGGNRMGIVHVSWLDPRKERTLTVVGDEKMAVYDDLAQEKIKIYDKGVSLPPASGDFADFQIACRHGGSYSPFVLEKEPLKAECSDFIRCISEKSHSLTDGENGLQVVEVLEAADMSLATDGAPIALAALHAGI